MTPGAAEPSDPALVADIRARADAVEARIRRACERAGRDPRTVTLVAVTKTHPASVVAAAAAAGLAAVGENRVQELAEKRDALGTVATVSGPPLAWHHIGRVQSNKARDLVRHADLVHGVDALHVAEALARRAEAAGRVLPVLVQVNISGEASKGGAEPADVPALVAAITAMPALRLDGLMGIAAPADDPEDARPAFRLLRTLRDASATAALPLAVLSMGMSDDLEVAVEEGATLVRVGSAIFGARG